jgi:ubiquinone/menaquinone biosynthesis C-methylase UbiE
LIKVVNAFNQIAHLYDAWYETHQGKQILDAEIKAVEAQIPRSGLGLEIGAGTGMFAAHINKFDRPIICLEPSKEMITRSLQRCRYTILGSGENIPLRSVTDFVYLVTVLEFISKPEKVLNEIKRISKNPTYLTLLFINADSSWGTFYKKLGERGDPIFKHAKLYDVGEVFELLEDSGYEVKKIIGTITTSPKNENVGGETSAPDSSAGVIVLHACSSLI